LTLIARLLILPLLLLLLLLCCAPLLCCLQYLTNEVVGDSLDTTSSMRTAFEQRLLQSNDTYVSLLNLSRSGLLTRQEEIRVVRGLLQDMQAAGAGQPGNRLARLNDIERRLTVLENQFMDNLQASQEVRVC
jgi:Zn-dependent oligopeptidase